MRARCRVVSIQVEIECELCGSKALCWIDFGTTDSSTCPNCGNINPVTFTYEAVRN